MATLTSKTPANTYKDLLKIASTSDNLGITSSLLVVEDGDATASSLSLSTVAAKITGALEVTALSTLANVAIASGTITGITDLAVADGGTGASTAATALNNLLPSQTSAASKYLQSDGTNASWDAVTLSTVDITGTLAVANGGTGVTSSTGTTNVVLSNSPTLVTPLLGTPTSATLTNATGLPISTGVSGLGTGVATFLGTPSSANLAAALTDETGTGALVFATSPVFTTPNIGSATGSISGNAATVTTNADLTGGVTSLGNAATVVTNANLTGHITSSGNAAVLGSFTVAQLSTAISDQDLSGTNTGDNATNSLYSGLVSNANHSGDATGSTALTLATVNTNVGAFTNASVTVNAKGLVTAASSGTAPVTSVSGTSPIVSSGGVTPAISIGAASASTSGALSNTDWSTFNSKGNGSVTSVAALTLGTTGTDLSSTVATSTTTPVITLNVPTASATNRGALSSTDWTTFNNKGSGNGTVTAVTGLSPISSSGGTTPAISITAASASNSGALSNTDWSTFNSKGSGSVTSVSVTTANGVSGTVATSTTTPAITVSLGSITPSAVQVSGLTASQILSTDASKNLTSLAVATYPSLTELAYVKGVTSAIQTQINAKGAGTVTSVSGTSPIVSSGGTTPTISIGSASASTSGALSNTDWSTFNSKGSGTVTSVATTGTVSGITLSGGTITSTGTITLGGTLSLTSGNVTTALGYTPVSNAGGTITGSLTVTGSLYKYIISPATYGASYNTVLGARASAQGILQLGNNGENTIVGGNTNTGGYLTFYVNSASDFVTSTNGSLALTISANTNAAFQGQVTASNLSGTNTGDNAGVTSIAVTSPISSTGGATPTISMVAATTILNGYLTATDWNTFNNKGSGTITSVTGTAPVVSSGGTTPAISMAAATTSVNGYLSAANWTTFNAKASVSYSTFTPTIFSYAGTTNSVTYTVQYGKYIKVDKFVYFTLRITYTALSMTGGYVAFGGLPFVVATSTSRQSVSFASFDNYLSGDLTKHMGSYFIGGLNQIFYSNYLGLAVTWASGVIPSSSNIDITGIYEATT